MAYKVIAGSCFLPSLNIMLEHGDTTPEELHELDAADLVKRGFLEPLDEWDVPAEKVADDPKPEEKPTNTGRRK